MAKAKPQLSKTQAKAELWRRGNLDWKLRPEQRRLKSELENTHVQLGVFNISRRWGKTYTLVTYAIEQAQRRKQKIRYAAAFKSDLEEFVITAFDQILEDCPEDLRPTYMSSKQEYRFPNGSIIKLVGLDKNKNGLRGNAINIIILDEGAFISNLKYQYTSVIIPATAKQKNIKIIVISTPPESPEHYFVELIAKAQTEENGYYVCLTIDDISDLDPVERQRLLDGVGGEDSPTARREFFCEIIVDETRAVIPEFTTAVEKACVREVPRPDKFDRYVGLDTGWIDGTGCLFGYFNFEEGKFIIEDEILLFKATSDVLALAIKAKESALYDQDAYRRVSDHDARLLDHLISIHGLHFSKTEKTDKEKQINKVRMWLKEGKIVIHPRCKRLISQLKSVVWNSSRTTYDRDALGGHFDLIDALIYLMRSVEWGKNPYPAHHGLNSERHFFNHATNQYVSESAQALERAFAPRRR